MIWQYNELFINLDWQISVAELQNSTSIYTLYEKIVNGSYIWQKVYNFYSNFGANLLNSQKTFIYSLVRK